MAQWMMLLLLLQGCLPKRGGRSRHMGHTIANRVDKADISKGKEPCQVPKSMIELEEYVNENADPNEPGPSVWRRIRQTPVPTSDDEWLPDEEAVGDRFDSEEDGISVESSPSTQALLPEERIRRPHKRPQASRHCEVALGNASTAAYLDHGKRIKTCTFCAAGLYESEVVKKGHIAGGALCCHYGKAASLSKHFDGPAPEPLQSLFDDHVSTEGKLFHRKVRYINSALQMASSTASVKHTPGPSMMVAEGNIYHLLNPLEASGDPQYVQLYMMDDREKELAKRITKMDENNDVGRYHPQPRTERDSVRQMVGDLQGMLHTCNPYIKEFKSVQEHLRDNTDDEVVAFEVNYIETDPKQKRGLRLLARNRVDCKKPVTIWDFSPLYEPLHFVLLYPRGTPGWHAGLGLTPQQYGAYWLHDRPGEYANFTKAGRLFQEWVLDTYVKVERQRLNYLKSDDFRRKKRGSVLGSLQQAVKEGKRKGAEAGTEVAEVPASHIGSRAYFRKKRYDSYALARVFGNPSLFITMTCNSGWEEIKSELQQGQAAEDRPDIVSRVFHIKLKQLKNDVLKGEVFGAAKALTYRVEFQKRGLPHVHMLVCLEDQALTKTGEGIEQVSRAWIPDPHSDKYGFDLVTKHMLHGPCDERCMRNGRCEDGYPMEFRDEMTVPNGSARGGYPIYRRPNDGRGVFKKNVWLDNRHVVPYNMYLLKRYNCHLNVMVCSGIEGIKYMFKYVYKQASRANISLSEKKASEDIESVDNFFDGLCIGSAEACWRLFGFELAGSSPSVQQLHVHTQGNQHVLFEEDRELKNVVAGARFKDTMLTAWFKFNAEEKRKYEAKLAEGTHGPTVPKPAALSTCYADIGSIASWDWKECRWKCRKRSSQCVGRLPFVHPSDKERWCLKQLLCALPGATSWDDLKTVLDDTGAPVVCATFEEACRQRGMLENDDLWCAGMDEAVKQSMPCQLRMMFVEMLTFCSISDPVRFWNRYKQSLSEDYLYDVDTKLRENPDDPSADTVAEDEHGRWSWRAVLDIQELLEDSRRTLREFGIPSPPQELITTEIEKEVRGYFNFSYQDIESNVAKLNLDQTAAFDQIMEAVERSNDRDYTGPTVFFVDGVGGSGKTFVYKTLMMIVRMQSPEDRERGVHPIAVAMASNGLPAQLLPSGTTVHRRFRLPITDDFEGQQLICNIPAQSEQAELLRRAKLIVWDEAPTMNRWHLDAVDRCLRDIMGQPDKLMGGKVVVLGGDFRQCGPVLKNSRGRGRRAAEVNASISHWKHWGKVEILRLHTNMRVQNCMSPDRRQRLEAWSQWLKRLGDGDLPLNEDGRLEVPSSIAFVPNRDDPETGERQFFEHMYADLRNKQGQDRDDFLKGTAVLVPKNDMADKVNDDLLDTLLDGQERVFVSTNGTTDPGHQRDDAYPEEFLASIRESSLPAHVIRLKVGAPIIALRNITKGVSNGTRMVVTKLLRHSIKARVLHGPSEGREILISRVEMTQNMGSFELKRCQLPIRVAFAMTINKAQGLTLRRVGVYLKDDVFSHGQLYVAFSRCGDNENLWVFGPEPDAQGKLWIKNVVYQEILIDR